MLASDNSSSGKSIQAYFSRKIRSREGEETGQSTISGTLPTIRESESSPITTTPVSNLSQRGSPTEVGLTNMTFRGPRPQSLDTDEFDQNRTANKRPRIGSVSTSCTRLQTEVPSQSTLHAGYDPNWRVIDEMKQEPCTGQLSAFSSSEFGIETDAESTTNPAGSTIAQALIVQSRKSFLEAGDSDSAFVPLGLPRSSLLGPTSRALIKEFFTNATRPLRSPKTSSVLSLRLWRKRLSGHPVT